MTSRPVLRLVMPASAALAVFLSSCGDVAVSREDYIGLWVLASLRAREKGTEPAEELEKALAARGISTVEFNDAQVRWFCEENLRSVRQAVKKRLLDERFLSRGRYIKGRVLACLRSEIAGTKMSDEIAAVGTLKDFKPESFFMAEKVWVGDAETDAEIVEYYQSLQGAKRVPRDLWLRLNASPGLEELKSSSRFEELLAESGVSPADWLAMEEIFGESQSAD